MKGKFRLKGRKKFLRKKLSPKMMWEGKYWCIAAGVKLTVWGVEGSHGFWTDVKTPLVTCDGFSICPDCFSRGFLVITQLVKASGDRMGNPPSRSLGLFGYFPERLVHSLRHSPSGFQNSSRHCLKDVPGNSTCPSISCRRLGIYCTFPRNSVFV
jgi:hypothetical protein